VIHFHADIICILFSLCMHTHTGNIDGARIYAESAIRDKNSALNYLRLSSRIDAVAARVNTAVKMKSLTKDMSGIVNSMNSAMKSMNVEKISAVMDQFESQFENLDLSTGFMEQSMASTTTNLMPESQVDTLMREVAVCISHHVISYLIMSYLSFASYCFV